MVRVWEVRPAGEGLARAGEAAGYEAQAGRVLAPIGGAAFGTPLGHVMRSVPFVTPPQGRRRPVSKNAPSMPAAWVSSSIMTHSVRVEARWPGLN